MFCKLVKNQAFWSNNICCCNLHSDKYLSEGYHIGLKTELIYCSKAQFSMLSPHESTVVVLGRVMRMVSVKWLVQVFQLFFVNILIFKSL